MAKQVVVLGTLDTKAQEFAYLCAELQRAGVQPLMINVGVIGEPPWSPRIDAHEVAEAGGTSLEALRELRDRGVAMRVMGEGAAYILRRLFDGGGVAGVIGMGGGGGSSVIATAMRSLPIGVPKLLVSTLAAGDTRPYVGSRDIAMLPSVVDVAGLNRISRQIITNAAGAIAGMVTIERDTETGERPLIAATMFGNTTACVNRARATLDAEGYEVLVFHATGTGGQTMESLIGDGFFSGVLDITTTEWADEVCGGVLTAGSARLDAAALNGVPQVVVPGCLDMANFGPRASMPSTFNDRLLYEWNPAVTLMRTTAEENRQMGRIFAEKLSRATAAVKVLIPLKGFSILDSPGERFWDPVADAAFTETLREHLRPDIPIEELDLNINDSPFADHATESLLKMLK